MQNSNPGACKICVVNLVQEEATNLANLKL